LERERIERIDRLFLTHWHWDHVSGIGELGEPASVRSWPTIDVYGTSDVADHFDEELSYLRPRMNIHRIGPGDRIDLPDGVWEVVKTDHTDQSVGFVIRAEREAAYAAYLVDGVVPPSPTVERLAGCDLLILEATLDELDEPGWKSFSVEQAVDFWSKTGVPECVLTHLSCHSWRNRQLVPGWLPEQRRQCEREHPGLRFAEDGMRTPL
jgi:phosphoribosyl 1,2-cyclic phosphate phosphodiesterase